MKHINIAPTLDLLTAVPAFDAAVQTPHLPIQNRLNMTPSKSSLVNSPVIEFN